MSTKKTTANKAAKTKSTPAVAAVTAPEKASTPEASLAVKVTRPEGTKFRRMLLGCGWTGSLPESDAKKLESIGHVTIEGVA